MQGFSEQNLYHIKCFYLFYSQGGGNLYQLGAKIEDSNFHQLGGELEKVDKQTTINRSQPENEFDNHPIFQIPWQQEREPVKFPD